MGWTLPQILKGAVAHHASDVHLVCGLPPVYRVGGEIRPVSGAPLEAEHMHGFLDELLNDEQRRRFDEQWQSCISTQLPDVGRVRVTTYLHSGTPEFAFRICSSEARSAEDLGLPPIVEELTRHATGMILVTGPTGVGKTTTLSYMIDCINQQRRAKIVTIEDPVEIEHPNRKSIIVQQEVATDVKSFRSALVHVLRQDPDVVVIGEMRDLETIETALTAAETGHLVLATLHTPDAAQTIQRIYSVFPAEQQNAITVQLANSLQAVVAQKLLPRADGKGRVLACEICIATGAVRSHIRDREPHRIFNELQTGRKHQMQSMDHALLTLYQQGLITYDTAVSHAREPDTIRHRTE